MVSSMRFLRCSWCRCPGLLAAVISAVLFPAAFGADYEIPFGSATVDGDLSEWADASWIAMDQVYYGDPSDVSEAKWAARWESDMVYVAATVVDTVHTFNATHITWNTEDALEVYLDAGNRNEEGYDYASATPFSTAQEWVMSPTGVGDDEWICIALDQLPPDQTAVPAFEVSVDGDTINYEIAMRPYDNFVLDDPASSTVFDLSVGMVIGLDAIVDTRWGTDENAFGMLCENTRGGKYTKAVEFIDVLLVEEVGVLAGDLNGDGSVNSGDLDIVRANWGHSVSGPENGDATGDGVVNSADLDIVRSEWGRTAAASAIPEPGMLALLLAMLVGLTSLRRP